MPAVNTRIVVAAGSAAVVLVAGLGLYELLRPAPARPSSDPIAVDRTALPPSETTPAPTAPAPADADRRSRPRPSRPVADEPAPGPAVAPAPAEPVAEAGTLRIEADVPGAQVFLDRQFIGTAPVTAENVTPGSHQLNVSAEGFDGIARTLDVTPGLRDVTVRFREVRLDATLAVVHKHRMGSCTGMLTATADGLRYHTDDAEDRFAVPLSDLDTFVVDYKEKNLRVRIRRGKQFNFTDPEGNADRLFVFHRDVDKTRQRLASGDRPASN
jgi:hypothetical protein